MVCGQGMEYYIERVITHVLDHLEFHVSDLHLRLESDTAAIGLTLRQLHIAQPNAERLKEKLLHTQVEVRVLLPPGSPQRSPQRSPHGSPQPRCR